MAYESIDDLLICGLAVRTSLFPGCNQQHGVRTKMPCGTIGFAIVDFSVAKTSRKRRAPARPAYIFDKKIAVSACEGHNFRLNSGPSAAIWQHHPVRGGWLRCI